MPSVNRASVSFIRAVDFEMVKELAELSGSSISNFVGCCMSEYLQQNYERLSAFYKASNHLLPHDVEAV